MIICPRHKVIFVIYAAIMIWRNLNQMVEYVRRGQYE